MNDRSNDRFMIIAMLTDWLCFTILVTLWAYQRIQEQTVVPQLTVTVTCEPGRAATGFQRGVTSSGEQARITFANPEEARRFCQWLRHDAVFEFDASKKAEGKVD